MAVSYAELHILDWIQTHLQSAGADRFFSAVTHLGDGGALWIALAVVLLLIPRTRQAGLAVALALVLDLLLCNLCLKPLIGRIRPFALQPVTLLIPPPADYAFPSGHTAASFAAVFALLFRRCRLWYWALIPAGVIAFSRLYLYVHFPTDILGGILAGLVTGFLGARAVNLLPKHGRLSKFMGQTMNHL